MKGAATFAAIAAIVVILIVALASAFTVEQTEGTRPAFRRAGRRARSHHHASSSPLRHGNSPLQ